MTQQEIFGLIAVGLTIVVDGVYVVSILQGKTKPHTFTWIVWSIIMGIVFTAQWTQNAGPGAWCVAANALGCITISSLSLFKGERDISKSDWFSFICALAVIPFWHLTQNALLAVGLATLIDAFAYYPTVRKSWIRPQEENLSAYAFSGFIWVTSLMAINDHSPTSLIYPIFCTVANTSLALMILLRRRNLLTSNSNY